MDCARACEHSFCALLCKNPLVVCCVYAMSHARQTGIVMRAHCDDDGSLHVQFNVNEPIK